MKERLQAAGRGLGRLVGMLAILVVGGTVLDPVVTPAWREVRAGLPAAPADTPLAGATERLVAGTLGGFRGMAANLAWLRLQGAWERSDPAAVETWIRVATRLDPRPPFFWIQGARMIAYDVPAWRIRTESRTAGGDLPQVVVRTTQREQGERALALLDQARRVHPDDPFVAAEIALVHLHRMGDLAEAARWYRRAAELPGAPGYAGRLHGELLRQLGRPDAALAWYEALLPTLDPADPWSGYDVVAARIRDLRRK